MSTSSHSYSAELGNFNQGNLLGRMGPSWMDLLFLDPLRRPEINSSPGIGDESGGRASWQRMAMGQSWRVAFRGDSKASRDQIGFHSGWTLAFSAPEDTRNQIQESNETAFAVPTQLSFLQAGLQEKGCMCGRSANAGAANRGCTAQPRMEASRNVTPRLFSGLLTLFSLKSNVY